jgi:hypothetical protein
MSEGDYIAVNKVRLTTDTEGNFRIALEYVGGITDERDRQQFLQRVTNPNPTEVLARPTISPNVRLSEGAIIMTSEKVQ